MGSVPAALLAELSRRGIDYVVVRGAHLLDTSAAGDVRVLVADGALERVDGVARELGFSRVSDRNGSERTWAAADGVCLRITACTTLEYGRGGLRTRPEERAILRRRRECGGVAVAAPGDELVDLVLHCILERRAFDELSRSRARTLLAELRADPPAAGGAAERVQLELAPALTWGELLDDVLHARWDDLLGRRARLQRHLARRSPRALLRGLGTRRRHEDVDETGAHAGARATAVAPPPDSASAPSVPPPERPSAEAVSRKQIRGSGLMLVGRGLSAGLKFASELIVVRYLTTGQYGAWTYALAAVTFLRGFSALGLNRAIVRYLPVHLERGEIRQFYGVLGVVTMLTAVAGAAIVAAYWAFPQVVASLAGVASEQPLQLLFILIFLVPVETFDNALQSVCAALGLSRQIFFRRFLLYPGIRLLIALVLVAAAADVTMLAWGYLVAGALGVGYYAWAVATRLRKQGLLKIRWLRSAPLPFGTVLGYTLPAMAADWGTVFLLTAGPLLLGYFSDMSTVALYQVVIPVAALNHLVPQAFAMLFEPSAARLVARGDREGLERHYWRTAMWVAVLSFPLFALSFTAAVPLITFLFGERYAAAAPILSIIAVSHFVEAAAGFNAGTLRVSGKIHWLIAANAIGVAVLLGVSIALIPSMGALGAGIGTAAGQLTNTALNQTFVRTAVGVEPLDHEHRGFYGMMVVVFAGLVAVRVFAPANLWVVAPAVLLGAGAVFVTARRSLSIRQTFPELERIPLLTRLLG